MLPPVVLYTTNPAFQCYLTTFVTQAASYVTYVPNSRGCLLLFRLLSPSCSSMQAALAKCSRKSQRTAATDPHFPNGDSVTHPPLASAHGSASLHITTAYAVCCGAGLSLEAQSLPSLLCSARCVQRWRLRCLGVLPAQPGIPPGKLMLQCTFCAPGGDAVLFLVRRTPCESLLAVSEGARPAA